MEDVSFPDGQAYLDGLREKKGVLWATIVHSVGMLKAIMSEAVTKKTDPHVIEQLANFGAVQTNALMNAGEYEGRAKEMMADVDLLLELAMNVIAKDKPAPEGVTLQ